MTVLMTPFPLIFKSLFYLTIISLLPSFTSLVGQLFRCRSPLLDISVPSLRYLLRSFVFLMQRLPASLWNSWAHFHFSWLRIISTMFIETYYIPLYIICVRERMAVGEDKFKSNSHILANIGNPSSWIDDLMSDGNIGRLSVENESYLERLTYISGLR